MPSLKDLLKKKEKIETEGSQPPPAALNVPEFTFIRSTTSDFETILTVGNEQKSKTKQSGEHKRTLGFRTSLHLPSHKEPAAATSTTTRASTEAESSTQTLPVRPKTERRLSDVLHLTNRSRSRSNAAEPSTNLPTDLPDAPEAAVTPQAGTKGSDNDNDAKEQREALWEKRATMLAMNSPLRDGRIVSETSQSSTASKSRPKSVSISDATGDVNIQEAIRLHEAGDLVRSTEMFGQLANPDEANNALAQVLYGLALRHGKQGKVKEERAVHMTRACIFEAASCQPALLSQFRDLQHIADLSFICAQAGVQQ